MSHVAPPSSNAKHAEKHAAPTPLALFVPLRRAFSTAENIEGLWALAHKTLISLSPQDIVDCSKSCSPEGVYGNVCNSGCQGGWPWSAYLDIIKEGGIASEASYPYKGVSGDCAFQGADTLPLDGGSSFPPRLVSSRITCRHMPRARPLIKYLEA